MLILKLDELIKSTLLADAYIDQEVYGFELVDNDVSGRSSCLHSHPAAGEAAAASAATASAAAAAGYGATVTQVHTLAWWVGMLVGMWIHVWMCG